MLAPQDPVGEGELDLGVLHREESPSTHNLKPTNEGGVDAHMELLDGGSAALVGSDHLHLHDLDGVGASTMAGAHVPICGQRRGRMKRPSCGEQAAPGRYSQHCVTAPDVVRSLYSLYML